MGGHADLVYHFDERTPVELLYEIKDEKTEKNFSLKKLSKSIKLKNLLLTAEAVRAVGDKTPLGEGGLKNFFVMAYRMTSVPERLIGPVVKEGRKTTVFDIPFEVEEVRRSLWDTVENQNRLGMSENYNLVTNNCITSAIRGLANGLTPEQEARIEKELHRTFRKISALSRNDISEAELNKLFNDYSKLINENKARIGATPISERPYFMDWLTDKQKVALRINGCKSLF